ncbi:intramembrane metalloprotease PrsW [Bacillus lacus]|uniref:Protease PrsW n=1 Tax=Metabacillus lacus TaxID=1983721 RepID=A0A7X2IWL9_9BACI|nr:glutamic-type intramembrane protease PrsW [Metabacillus lacus]MRX71024.1 intramembrane metalloprotease PrsW [Metabacillus lacus]
MLAIISAGIAPGLALLSYFYLRDKYETEPVSMVIRAFIFGVLLVFPIMFLQYVIELEQVFSNPAVHIFFTYGFLEEFFKWFILFYTIYQHVQFSEHYDGIVYSVAVAMGFATFENILYLFANGIEHAFGRAMLPVSSHALFGVVMGYYLGKSKFSEKKDRPKWLFLSLFIPFLLHGTYDLILYLYHHWLFIILPFMVFLWWFGLRKARKANVIEQHADY